MKTLSNLPKAVVILTPVLSLVILFGFSNLSGNKETGKDLKNLAQKVIDAFNNRTPEVFDKVSAPKLIYHYGSAVESEELSWHSFYENNLASYPDFKFIIEDIIAEGNKVVVRFIFEGTHKTYSKKVRVLDHWIGRAEDGKFVEAWEIVDLFGLYKQLGYTLTPPPEKKDIK
jgi:predicted ester cyclase